MSDVGRIGVRMANQGAAANANHPTGTGNDLTSGLTEFRRMLATEQGTEPNCPFCQVPRVRRSDYIRCNGCGVNWLDQEKELPNYLNRNPAAARNDARMAALVSKPVAISEAVAS